ncbi:MAG: RimK family alpha-L-glutamate ligase [Pseudomonadota bacterium]
MIIGIMSAKSHHYHPTRRLMEAAKGMGHKAILVDPRKLFLGVDDGGLRIGFLTKPVRADIIMPRIGGTIKEYSLTMIRHFELSGIRLINNYDAVMLTRNKFLTLQTLILKGISVPESRYVSNWFNFDRAVSELGGYPLVIKTTHGRQGRGVQLVASMDKSRARLEGLLNTGQGLLIQKFIPPDKRRDIRVMVVGKRIVGAMSLMPRKGDFRANIHLHGSAEKVRPTNRMSTLAINASRALGLDISGVDMIQEKDGTLRVIDVNYSPGFKGLEKCTGIDVASEIIRYVTGS